MLQTHLLTQSVTVRRKTTKAKSIWVLKKIALEIAEGKILDSFFRKQKSKYNDVPYLWNCETRHDGIYIDICTIPDRHKYFPPDEVVVQVAEQIKQRDQQARLHNPDQGKSSEVYSSMFSAKNNFPLYYNKIKELHPNLKTEKITEYAIKWAVWAWITENYKRFACSLEIFFAAYCKVVPGHFTGDTSKVSFKKFHTRILSEGIEAVIVNKKSVNTVKSRQPEKHVQVLKAAYISSNTTTARDMHRALEKMCALWSEKCMSYESVKIYFRKFEKDIELYKAKRGSTAAATKMPYLSQDNAKHRNSLWYQDGKVLPFFTQREGEAGGERYTVSLLMDSHSQMIINYGIGKRENADMIFDVIYQAVCSTGELPPEFITDKHSGLRTGLGVNFIAQYEKMGGTFTASTNPQAKARLERKNSYLDAFWKQFDGYLGQGQNAKGKNARPSVEELSEAFKTKNYKSPDETKALAIAAIQHYNNTPQSCLNGLTPKQAYEQSESKHAFKISTEDRVKLFRPFTTRIIRKGQIDIKIGTVKYEYQLSADLYDRYNDMTVNVSYEDLKDEIYLFDIRSGNFIGTVPLKKRVPCAKVDRTAEDEQLLHKFTGRKKGIQSKAEKRNDAALVETMKHNPEFAEEVNYLLANKDIAAEIANNRALQLVMADNDVRVDNIPLRSVKPLIVVKERKAKATPFEAVGNEIRQLDSDEIF